jgi:2-oxo-4-hydroxy-4-carboxy--5-ureidoimidazoline (OHCU) decarboxylase
MGVSTATSWDSFAYALMMNHNVYTHIRSVQEANRAYDNGDYPTMLVDDRFDRTEVKDVIARIFEIDDRDKQLQMIDDHSRLWMRVIGTRGYTGKKSVNASTQFNNLFSEA